jgi:hypothetical protein
LDLLRKVDLHSKDPSVKRALLRRWHGQLIKRFGEGNIFRDPSPGAGTDERDPDVLRSSRAKTATQIAMEQIMYIGEIDYAGHVQDFMAVGPKKLVERGMREMHEDCTAARDRMDADFTDNDLYMCLEVFDLDAWSPLLSLASTQSLLALHDLASIRLAKKLQS